MKFTKLFVKNFGSYKDFNIDLANLGLVGIFGDTGAGKSTILDMVPWILFGETSKELKADDIRTWNSEEPTEGSLQVNLNNGKSLVVRRIRGSTTQNDLYLVYSDAPFTKIRGKNLQETQTLLNTALNINSDLYFTSAYLHQFSKADTFFISRPSERRELFEKIVDQSFPIELSEYLSTKGKEVKASIANCDLRLSRLSGELSSKIDQEKKLKIYYKQFEVNQNALITSAKYLSDQFSTKIRVDRENLEISKNLLDPIDQLKEKETEFTLECRILQDKINYANQKICPTCKRPLDGTHVEEDPKLLIKTLDVKRSLLHAVRLNLKSHESFDIALAKIPTENPHLVQITELENKKNPYEDQLFDCKNELKDLQNSVDIENRTMQGLGTLKHKIDLLQSLVLDLRGIILSTALSDIEKQANDILTTYFDSEILIQLKLESSDKLEVEIQKNGNMCSFRQLSGGQRCMLKLAFNLSIMSLAENKAGIKFPTLMLDEPLNGLSEDLKVRAFSLFESLTKSYDTILIIEHSEALKACFNNKIMVTIIGDESKADIR